MSKDPESYIKISRKDLAEKLYPTILDDIFKVCTINTFKNFEDIRNWEYSHFLVRLYYKIFKNPLKLPLKECVEYYHNMYMETSKNGNCWTYGFLHDAMDNDTYITFIENMRTLMQYSTDENILLCEDDVLRLDKVINKAKLVSTEKYIALYEKYKPLFSICSIGKKI